MVHKYYRGQQITFSMKLRSNEYVDKYIAKYHKDKTIREMYIGIL